MNKFTLITKIITQIISIGAHHPVYQRILSYLAKSRNSEL